MSAGPGPGVGPAAHGAPPAAGDFTQALAAARACAPYLAGLAERHPDLAAALGAGRAREETEAALAAMRDAGGEADFEAAMRLMRLAKRRAHLAIAVADLARAWTLEEVTGALSDLADAALRSALTVAARQLAARGQMAPPEPDAPAGPAPGLLVIAMGKHGARELNYSSDIDFSVFFDPARLVALKGADAKSLALRLAQLMVRALEEMTPDGYVFRTDLRLRPDPASTPIAVSLPMAERYYQSMGQNWERAAFIKARAAAGDVAAGEEFLEVLEPFLWRRHLDYAAIADIRSIKRQILTHKRADEIGAGPIDVKLGRGGIRDIELFVQTQQLILGGRDRDLRARPTREALTALTTAGHVAPAHQAALSEAYGFLRDVEHRIQMLRDEQTHKVPEGEEDRARLACLCGFADWPGLEAALTARRRTVAAIDASLFAADESLADPMGALSFTGVENDPETLNTLRHLGFAAPHVVAETVRGWHHGRIRAMRSERARELFTALTPKLLRALAESGEPDAAFARFADFFASLNAGVSFLSLLSAQPRLLADLADVLGMAPALAQTLSRRPAMLDALLEADFRRPLREDLAGARARALAELLAVEDGFEAKINAARRFHREEALRIGLQMLQSEASAEEAGAAHADLAEACVAALAEVAREETRRIGGDFAGRFVIVAQGKFGGCELAAGSDLDIMLVFDAPAGEGEAFARLAQRLVSALSAPTEEGALYDVDMQLRPSGKTGPVAVRLSSFARYYLEEAWTWELMALTRARIVAGDESLRADVERAIAAAFAAERDGGKILADALDMRRRMERERPGRGVWDLKLAAGGFVDIEFVAQALTLTGGLAPRANTGEALEALREAGALAADEAQTLIDAWRLYSALQQILRLCAGDAFDPKAAPDRMLRLLARAGGAASFDALEADVAARQRAVREVFLRRIATDGGATPV